MKQIDSEIFNPGSLTNQYPFPIILQITISMKYFVTNTYATSPTPQADVTCASPTFMNELSIKN